MTTKLLDRIARFAACLLWIEAVALAPIIVVTPVHAQWADQRTWGGTSTGSSNAYSISIPNWNQTQGVPIRFRPNFTNSPVSGSPHTATLTVNSLSAQPIYKVGTGGSFVDLTGGELQTNADAIVLWNSSASGYVLMNPNDLASGGWNCNVRYAGAVGDGSTDDSAAFAVCVAYAEAHGGGTIIIPHGVGQYCLDSGMTIPSGNSVSVSIIGEDRFVGVSSCNNDVSVISLGGYSDIVNNFSIVGRGGNQSDTFSFSQPALKLNGCTQCLIENVDVTGGTNAIQIIGGGDWVLFNTLSYNAYGGAAVYVGSGSSSATTGGWFIRTKIDQNYPKSLPGAAGQGCAPTTWTASTSYSPTSGPCPGYFPIVVLSGYRLQLVQAGTTGVSPPALKPYGVTICDPTCTAGAAEWKVVGAEDYFGLQLDSGVDQFSGFQMDVDGSYTASMVMTNSQGYGNGTPTLVNIDESNFGQGAQQVILLDSGSVFQMSNSTVSSCVQSGCSLLETGSDGVHVPWADVVALTNNTFFAGSVGINHGHGTNLSAQNNRFYGLSTAAFSVAAGVTDFIFNSNQCGNSTLGGNAQCYDVNSSGTDYYVISGNNTHNNGTPSTPANGAGAVHSYVAGNIGP